jgi:glutaredoxin-like protein
MSAVKFGSKVGQPVPNVVFPLRKNDEWVQLNSDDIFKGKTVAVFSLPGAFTPTCSSTHLPRYNELAQTFKDNGVDEIVCISVNDTFVMNAWAKDQEADNITLIADGNGQFTEQMGLLVDKSEIGFGKRSWRYSMLVKDGVVDQMWIEPNKPGDPFEVSDADTMLDFINPDAIKPQPISVFTKPGCPFCQAAKSLLNEQGLAFEEIVLGRDASLVSLKAITGSTTVPQEFIGGEYVGDSEQLKAHFS